MDFEIIGNIEAVEVIAVGPRFVFSLICKKSMGADDGVNLRVLPASEFRTEKSAG